MLLGKSPSQHYMLHLSLPAPGATVLPIPSIISYSQLLQSMCVLFLVQSPMQHDPSYEYWLLRTIAVMLTKSVMYELKTH